MSLPKTLAETALNKIIEKYNLEEVHGSDGGPLMTLSSQMGPDPVGHTRVFKGGPLLQVINVGIVVPQIGLDSHMVFAFTQSDSVIPHFTVDSVFAGGSYAFHLDLIPRVDLGANLEYMEAAFEPLTEYFTAAQSIEGLSQAKLSPKQCALMSPWMLAFRANEEAFTKIEAHVSAYLKHWMGLLEDGIRADWVSTDVAERGQRNKDAIFNPDVDPVWQQIGRLLGEEQCERIRSLCKSSAV